MRCWSQTESLVIDALQPRLGLRLSCYLAEDCARCVGDRRPENAGQLLEEAAQLEKILLRQLYRALGVSMVFCREDGVYLRISTEDLPGLADDILGAVMLRLPEDAAGWAIVSEYAMRSGSLAALRLLITRYASCYQAQELDVMRRIAEERSR